MIRAAAILILILACAAALALRWAPIGPSVDFRYVNSSDIHTLDPARMSWNQDLRLGLNLWEGLLTTDPRTLLSAAGVAEFPPVVSDDGVTWTFHLLTDARWSDGSSVTAEDFIRAWRRNIEPGTAADYAFFLTDTVAGAAEYAAWRSESVAVLTALARRAQGWPLDVKQNQILLNSPAAQPVRDALRDRARGNKGTTSVGAVPDPPPRTTDDASETDLNSIDLPWPALHEAALRRHAVDMEARFRGVGLEAPDPMTLVVHLRKPVAYFADLVTFPTMSPIHESIERLREGSPNPSDPAGLAAPLTPEGLVTYDPQWTKPDYHARGYTGLITNGPYRLTAWAFKRGIRLEVNPFHRDAARIPCRTIEGVVIEDANAALLAYEAGDVDFIPTIETPYDHVIFQQAASGKRPDFHVCALAGVFFFNFNCQAPSVGDRPNPFTDARVRRAFCLATDRRTLVRDVLQRGDRPAGSFVPRDTIPGYDPPDGLVFDVSQARALLAEAGYPDGTGLPVVELLFNTGGGQAAVCQAVARMWELNLGARVELVGKESKTFAEDKAAGRFMIARANWYADYNDPTTFLDVLITDNGNNDSGYASTAYDRLMHEAAAERDPARRMGLLRQAETIAVEVDCPILPLFHYCGLTAIRPGVEGLHPNARLVFPFKEVSVR